jgi:UDP-D-galactose:(glucosyl)LPS alpha-1,6-D-galactosyltransferase
MKIAIISFGLSGKGGMETVLSKVISELNNNGDDTRLFILGGCKDNGWLKSINHYSIGCPTQSKIFRYLKYTFIFPFLLKNFNPNLIIAVSPTAVLISRILSNILNIKAVIGSWVHFSLTVLNDKKYLKYADFHLSICKGVTDQIQELLQTDSKRIHTIYNPVEKVDKTILRPDKATFIYIGRLISGGDKCVEDFIQTLSKLKGEWSAKIIGDGPDREELEDLAIYLGINGKIEWTGWVQKPWEIVNSASCLVLTSKSEGFGMVLAEAVSRGIVCVSSDCLTGPRELVKDGENGWLYPVGNEEKLTSILQKIIDDEIEYPSFERVKASIDYCYINNFFERFNRILRIESETNK